MEIASNASLTTTQDGICCRPLARTTTFVQVWSNHPQASGPAGAIMDTNTLGSERGLTFWRPRLPIGYASLGDCVTTGTMQPTFQVDPIITNMCHTSLMYALRTLLNWLVFFNIAMNCPP